MPRYDYYCEANGREIEVTHAMTERLSTWAEVCERAGIPLGKTQARAPVEKLIGGSGVVRASVLKTPEGPPCGGGPCGTGRCSFE